jgi:hypothetical protein
LNAWPFAVQQHDSQKQPLVDNIFIPAIKYFIHHHDPRWVNGVWYLPEAEKFFRGLSPDATALVLQSLLPLKKIDNHAEKILEFVAMNEPSAVWNFLKSRFERDRDGIERYEPIPYRFRALKQPLGCDVQLATRTLRQWYRARDRDFRFTGGRLLNAVFPKFTDELATSLIDVVAGGSQEDFDFAIALLENYTGEVPTHGVVQELIDRLPGDDTRLKNLDICLSKTGVVSGEFGWVEAYRGCGT